MIEVNGTLARVSYFINGFELVGWTNQGSEREGTCEPRIEALSSNSSAILQGGLRARTGAAVSALTRTRSVFWLEEVDGRLSCTHVQIDWQKGRKGADVKIRDDKNDGVLAYGLYIAPAGSLTLTGPSFLPNGKGHAWASICATRAMVVDVDESGLRVINQLVEQPHFAYQPGDAETWFLDRKACERAIANLNTDFALGQFETRLHSGC